MQHDTWIDKLSKGAGGLAALMIVPAIVISTFEVIARYVFNAPTNWVFPTAIALCAISYILSGPYLLQRHEFIRVTFIYDKLGARSRHVIDLISATFEFLWASVLTVASAMQAYPSFFRFRGGDWRPETLSGAWNAPIPAIVRVMLFLACLLLLLQAIVSLLRRLRNSKPVDMKGNTYAD